MVKIDHIGIVVKDIEKATELFISLGFMKTKDICIDKIQNNKLQMMEDTRENRIELIQPLNEKSTVINAKEGLHHIALKDKNEKLRKNIENEKIGKIFTEKLVAPLFDNCKVEFCYVPENNIIIELVEE